VVETKNTIELSDIMDVEIAPTVKEGVSQEKSYYQMLEDSTDAQLAEMHVKKFKKPVHHKMKREGLIRKLSE
jgi:hypothetical protein